MGRLLATFRGGRAGVFAHAVLLLFFLQSLTSLVERLYSYGLIATGVPLESAGVLFLLSPLLLWRFPSEPPAFVVPVLVLLALACRLAYPLTGPTLETLLAGLAMSAFLLLIPLLLVEPRAGFTHFGSSFSLAVALLVCFRALGSGVDLSMHDLGQVIAWPLGTYAALVVARGNVTSADLPKPSSQRSTGVGFPSAGMMACFALVVSVFSAPNVVSRWSGFAYEPLELAIFAGLLVYSLLLLRPLSLPLFRGLGFLGVSQLAVLLCLLLTTLLQQVDFPTAVDPYPLRVEPLPRWQTLPALLLMLLTPAVIHSSFCFERQIVARCPSVKEVAFGFSVGAALLVVLLLAQILTVTYDYVPVMGPLFRNRFWLVVGLLGLAPAIGLLGRWVNASLPVAGVSGTVALTGLGVVSLVGLLFVSSSPPAPSGTVASLRIATFNIQQGFAANGDNGLQSQLDLLRELRPDILGLQESDTNRISSGNADAVRYFADNLDLYSYYGPSPVVGTFGVALLSRYPIEDPRTVYLWSEGEQTAAVVATVRVNGKALNIVVTHLGNGGPQIQLDEVLQEASASNPVVLLGDFNFRPTDEQYRETLRLLDDSWLLRWPSGVGEDGQTRSEALDHIFVSAGIQVLDARYVETAGSDHPAYLVEVNPCYICMGGRIR